MDDDATVGGTEPDVREILGGIAAEGELARIDARVEELAGDLERMTAEAERADGTRRGELEMMRARIEDALAHVRETTEEQRAAWQEFDERVGRGLDSVRNDLVRLADAARAEVRAVRDGVAIAADELELRVQGDLESVRGEIAALSEGEGSRIEALRREIDGGVAEVRAEQRLALQRLDEAVADISGRVVGQLEELQSGMAEDRTQLREALQSAAVTMRETAQDLRQSIERERAARGEALRTLGERVDDVVGRLDRLDGRVSGETGRHDADVVRVERRVQEIADRLAAVEREGTTVVAQPSAEIDEVIADLTRRVERAESIAREAGRVIVNAVRRSRGGTPHPQVDEPTDVARDEPTDVGQGEQLELSPPAGSPSPSP